MASETFTLEVVTPECLVIRETVTDAQIPVRNGYIGVLAGHTPLLAALGFGVLSYRVGDRERSCSAMGGFVEVLAERVIVLADRAERAEEIDVARATAARARAQKRLASPAGPDIDWRRALDALDRAQARLDAASGPGAPHLLDSGHEAF